MKRKLSTRDPMTLQGICLVTLAKQLPADDISAVQKAFKTEIVNRERARVVDIVASALPTWVKMDGFDVMTHAISGTYRGLRISVSPDGKKYGSFVASRGSTVFNSLARMPGRGGDNTIPTKRVHQYMQWSLEKLAPRADHASMIQEYVAFMRNKRTLLEDTE